jgi:N-glycosylase/DNA lyase
MVAEEWLDQLEEIFRVTRSGDQDKVDLATYRLRGEASQWWKRHREHMEATEGHMTWEEFKTLFLNKYFPSNVKDQKEIEFLTLQQGDMTVDEYVATFESLARFSNNLQNQPDEA